MKNLLIDLDISPVADGIYLKNHLYRILVDIAGAAAAAFLFTLDAPEMFGEMFKIRLAQFLIVTYLIAGIKYLASRQKSRAEG